jgi:hypothetical protein
MMRVKGLLFLFVIAIYIPTFSNPVDSIVRVGEIKYSTDFEKDNFRRFFVNQEKVDHLQLFVATAKTSNTSTYRNVSQKVESILKQLDGEELTKKPDAKKIKIIYKTVHDALLKKYELNNNFNEIFTTGNYNCVSATALYALILEKYNIPFTIKKAPNHVFLLTYPNSSKILIETTDPVKGYFQYNDQMIAKYIDHLKKSKMISEEEFMTKSQTELFEKHFLKDENIDLKQLVGLQYYNMAIYEHENEKYTEAFEYMQKAYLFYPTEAMQFLMKNLLLNVISRLNYESEDDVKYYVYLTRFKPEENSELNAETIGNEFRRITEKQLVLKSNFALYNKSYNMVSQNVVDTTLKKEIDFIYNFEIARVVINSQKEQDIEENIKQVQLLKPEHMEVHGLITTYVLNQVSTQTNPQQIVLLLDQYATQFIFLKNNSRVNTIYGSCYLELAAQSYAQNQLSKGDKYLGSFEESVKVKEKSGINEFYINKSFSEASSAYYRKGNQAKAKSLIMKGLDYAPDSYYLQVRLKSFSK